MSCLRPFQLSCSLLAALACASGSAQAQTASQQPNLSHAPAKTSVYYSAASSWNASERENVAVFSMYLDRIEDKRRPDGGLFLVDSLQEGVVFYNHGFQGQSGATPYPIAFSENDARLPYSYASSVGYAASSARPQSFADCNYSPRPGYDPKVRHICINVAAAPDADDANWQYAQWKYRAKIRRTSSAQ